MVTTTRPTITRLDTPAGWTAAEDRAQARNIQVWQDQSTGAFYATSSDGTTHYRVGWYSCQCAAGLGNDPVCLHRAAFRAHCREEDRQMERLLRESAAIVPARMCTSCLDSGWARMSLGHGLTDYTMVVCGCGAAQDVA